MQRSRLRQRSPQLLFEQQWDRTRELQGHLGRVVPWVVHDDSGKQVRFFYRSGKTACRKAGPPGKLVHDFRRSAVRRMKLAGVPRPAAKRMVGDKTDSIYERYAIADLAMIEEAGERLAAFEREHSKSPRFGLGRLP